MNTPDAEKWVETYSNLMKMSSSLKIFHPKTQNFVKNAIFGINRKIFSLKSCRKLLIFDENVEKNKTLKNSSIF